MASSEWFEHEVLLDESQLAYVTKLRELAAVWQFDDLMPVHSRSWPWPPDASRLLSEVDVPGLTCGPYTLRVLYSPGGAAHSVLESEWGDKYLFDGPTYSFGPMVDGVEATSQRCAEWTAAWFEGELLRPVVRREWDRPPNGVGRMLPSHTELLAAVEWRFADTDELLTSTSGVVWSWLTRTPPSREVLERPQAAAAAPDGERGTSSRPAATGVGWLRRGWAGPLPDPGIDAFRHALGSLTAGGVLAGYLFTRVETFWGPGRPFGLQNGIWLYFHYLDNADADPANQEQWEEDYPPWAFRDELERGQFRDPDREVTYQVRWLTGVERAAAFETIGMDDPAVADADETCDPKDSRK